MTEDEALTNRRFLFRIAVARHDYTDWPDVTWWPDGTDDGDVMRGEWRVPEEKEPIDLGWWIVFGVWLVVGILIVAVMKKFVAS